MDDIVLVHGSGLGARSLSRLATELGGRAIDLPGYPTCDAPSKPPFEGDCVAVVDALAGADTLFGHSYGGTVALEVASRVRLRRLVLYEPVLVTNVSSAEAFLSLDDGPEPFLERLIEYWNGPGAWRALPSGARAMHVARVARIHAEVAELLRHPRPLPDVTTPTLILRGDHGHVDSETACVALKDHLADARIEVIEGADHMGPVTRPDLVAVAVRRFSK